MKVFTQGHNQWQQLFNDLKTKGSLIHARGTSSLELENYCIEFNPLSDPYCLFEARNLSFKYLAGELAWYLKGDRDDRRIEHYSKFWATIANASSPRFNSNYGYYYFAENQFIHCYEALVKDKDTRQACIMINRADVMMSDAKDKLCTNSVMFRIRDNKLNMTVQMRSNDAVFGLGIDAVLFSWMYQMLFVLLKDMYPELSVGTYFHTAGSMHVYDRHYEMMEEIATGKGAYHLQIPIIERSSEAIYLLGKFAYIEEIVRNNEQFDVHSEHKFTNFLYDALGGLEPFRLIKPDDSTQ